ncbi:MAG TPA: GNAT family N-acetyltransferase [Candidatus Acidoferrum sp.]|nr:GNAT family N-acetyltransferase [Candidatus Acidoferrum sp.]
MQNGIVVCRVSSWITGTRLVSLPFSDHCEPLLDNFQELPEFMSVLKAECDRQRGRYVELRPLSGIQDVGHGLQPSCSYWFHELDLRPGLVKLFGAMHRSAFQRKVRRAEREGLSYETGRSEQLLNEFYRLLLMTRKRHQLPPQPRAWFRNLVECMGDRVQFMVARKNGAPIAAMLTLRHRLTVVYKYGCSDERFHSLGGMPFLFWRLVEESKASGAESIDFGRSDLKDEGLIIFKDRLGTSRKLLTYYRYARTAKQGAATFQDSRTVHQLFSLLPEAIASAAGRVLYRHMG